MSEKLNSKHLKESAKKLAVLWALILLCIIAAIASPKFATSSNIINVLRQTSMNGIIALGMTFVCLTGGVDLSVGSIVGLVGVVLAILLKRNVHPFFAILLALASGGVVGCLNGIGVVKGNLPPFIMTLGSCTAIAGLNLILSNGYPMNWREVSYDIRFIGQGYIWGVPVPVYIFIFLFALCYYILKYTRFGRSVYSVGDNREAARLSGVNIKRTELLCFVITGLAAAVSSIVLTAKLNTADPNSGTGYELDALSMVYIGGISSAGGTGSIVGTLFGAMLITVLSNMQNLLGISPYIQKLVEGLIVIAAVLLSTNLSKRKDS